MKPFKTTSIRNACCTLVCIVGISILSLGQTEEKILKRGKYIPKFTGIYSSTHPSEINTNESTYDGSQFPEKFPLDKNHCKEDVSKRTLKSRTFVSDDAQTVVQNSYANIFYYDANKNLQLLNTKLQKAQNGWAAPHQEFPLYLNTDGSTEITAGSDKVKFNFKCKINNVPINNSDFTVGENGMYIHNVLQNIDKKVVFAENSIETDYIINHPLNLTDDNLVFSEELDLPAGCRLVKETNSIYPTLEEYVIYSGNSVKARFKTPVFFDAKRNYIIGKYNIVAENGKTILQILVPNAWLNDASRVYPVIVDPLVIGPDTMYPSIYMGSCALPNFNSDSILITIPANITITAFIVTDSYFADETQPGISMSDGHISLTSPCGTTPVYSVGGAIGDTAGYAYLDSADLKSMLSCCFSPSCVTQTFWLAHHLARSAWLGVGCTYLAGVPPFNFVYYSPMTPWPFNAFIVGHSVETTQPQWTLIPNTVCSDSCHIKLRVITNYGVPPYTITHPWFAGSSTYGASVGSCNSTGIDTIPLTIPGCPTYCSTTPTMSVPPPTIVDVCGNTVTGLSNKNITINNVPDVTTTGVSVCSGAPINMTNTSCIATSTYVWTGSNGTSGTGNIIDNVTNPGPASITVTYTVLPTANGCAGLQDTVTATIYPTPLLVVNPPPAVCAPASVNITNPAVTAGSTTGTTISYWTNAAGTTSLTNPTSITAGGTYYIESSVGGCSVISPVNVSINTTPILTTNNVTGCLPNSADLTEPAVTAGSTGGGTLTYWANAGATVPLANPNVVVSNGTYYIVSANGTCADTAAVAVTFTTGPVINIINADTTIQYGNAVQLNATGGASYTWSGTWGLSCSTCPNPIANPPITMTYTVTGTDASSCPGSDSVTITIVGGENILYIPNCITPNHDGDNEFFLVYGVNIKSINMKIFDRWGEMIFESDDIKKGWDGRFRDVFVQTGVYVYAVECEWNDGNKVVKRGGVTVIY